MKVLGIDPGEKNIGIAISDPTGTLARPLTSLQHVSRKVNAERIISLAENEKVGLIIIGQATDINGVPNYSGRKSRRLAGEIRAHTKIPVELWDESYSTQEAQEIKIILGVSRKDREGHLDEFAASIILQSFLDAHAADNTADENLP